MLCWSQDHLQPKVKPQSLYSQILDRKQTPHAHQTHKTGSGLVPLPVLSPHLTPVCCQPPCSGLLHACWENTQWWCHTSSPQPQQVDLPNGSHPILYTLTSRGDVSEVDTSNHMMLNIQLSARQCKRGRSHLPELLIHVLEAQAAAGSTSPVWAPGGEEAVPATPYHLPRYLQNPGMAVPSCSTAPDHAKGAVLVPRDGPCTKAHGCSLLEQPPERNSHYAPPSHTFTIFLAVHI